MGELPTGTVTLLFSDMEGSTRLLARLGPLYVEALQRQRDLLRGAWSDHGGVELGTEGDSFFVVFPDAPSAVRAALQAQQEVNAASWPLQERVLVRMGIHTGAPMLHGEGYVGMDVHRAARVAGAAVGGQVLLTDATAALVSGEPIELLDLGFHSLKDLPRPEHLFQLVIPESPTKVRGVRAIGSVVTLPTPPTPLVGRDSELTELAALYEQPELRMVTLTGPGGTGKTRLATALAAVTAESYAQGATFVALEAVATPELMWTTIAAALDVPPEGRTPPQLFDHIVERSALLVLDNLEQIEEAAVVIKELLVEAPSLRVVATSRHPLHLPIEQEFPVPPLPLPDAEDSPSVEESPAVQLLVRQAQRVKPSFTLNADNRAAVAEICIRLDGLPLALELAAARLKLLTPQALLSRLDAALDLRSRDVTEVDRHQSLRQTIAWSYDLLDDVEKRLFRCLSVFAGGADLEGVAAVWAAVDASGADPVDVLERLVDACLVSVADVPGGNPRFSMLNTVRAYAREALLASGEERAVMEAFVSHFDQLVRDLERQRTTAWVDRLTSRLEVDQDNYRACLAWLLDFVAQAPAEHDRLSVALQLCWRLDVWYLAMRGHREEARHWHERTLELAGERQGIRVAACQAALAHNHLLARAVQDADRLSNEALSSASVSDVDCDLTAEEVAEMSFLVRNVRAIVAHEAGKPGEAKELFQRVVNETGDPTMLTVALLNFSYTLDRGDPRRRRILGQAAEVARQAGHEAVLVEVEQQLAGDQRALGAPDEAEKRLRALYPRVLTLRDSSVELLIAEEYAATLAELGRLEAAAIVLGAADALRERIRLPRDASQQRDIGDAVGIARDGLGARWEESVTRGRDLTLQRALHQAMSSLEGDDTVGSGPAGGP